MTKSFFPFDAGAGADVTETEWRKMGRLWLTAGVATWIPDGLEVYADSSGMQVKIRPGVGWVRGHYYENDAEEIKAISGNSSGSTRVDRVVLQADFTANVVDTVVKEGTPGGGAPSLTQTSSIWEIPLAQVSVVDGAVTIAAGDVTDEREEARPGSGAPVHLARSFRRSTVASIGSTEADLPDLSVTFTPLRGRLTKTTFFCADFTGTAAGDVFELKVTDGANGRKDSRNVLIDKTGSQDGGGTLTVLEENLAAVSHTRKVRAVRLFGTGTGTLVAASTAPAFILVEDLGPA